MDSEIRKNIIEIFVKDGKVPPVRTAHKFILKIQNTKPEIIEYINHLFPGKTIENKNIMEILYCIYNNINEIPKCVVCGKECIFTGWQKGGYSKVCSQKCHIINQQQILHNNKYYDNRKEIRLRKTNPEFFYDWNVISDVCDKWILNNFLRFNRKKICLDSNKLPGGMWYKSSINKNFKDKVIKYIINRFDNSNNIEENLYWLYHNINVRPVCEVCGKPVKFNGFVLGYGRTCSHSCKTLHPNTREKFKNTMLNKYGVEEPLSSLQIRQKGKETIIQRHKENYYNRPHSNVTTWSSKGEQHIFNLLKKLYPDTLQFYRDKRYSNPRNGYCWECDFYIPSKDIFIEYQGFRSHGLHPYNKYDKNDINKLNELKEKLNNKSLSIGQKNIINTDINVWTKNDVFKRRIAKDNNLKYIEIFERKLNIIDEKFLLDKIKEVDN